MTPRRRAGSDEQAGMFLPRTVLRNLSNVLILLAALVFVLGGVRLFDTGGDTGNAHVIDGDSLKINDTDIRLFGIDAPEYRQDCMDEARKPWPCGREAMRALSELSRDQTVSCIAQDSDRYGRSVAICRTPTSELNREMVRLGWAIAYRRHSHDYVPSEDAARRARRGIWRGSFEEPQRWRERHRTARGALGSIMADD
jgi:endonuclease YncB( thermonuclease family)